MKKLFLTTAIITTFFAQGALADDANLKAELEMLKSQLKAQQALISKLEQKLDSNIEKQQTEIATLKAAPAKASSGGVVGDVKISMSPSPKIESTDGKYSFQPMGRVHLDTAFFDDDKNDHPDASTFRRARLGFKGKLDENLEYRAEFDFGNKSSAEGASLKDVYLAYTGLPVNIKIGNFKPAYGLEELGSSNYLTFIEPSLATGAFATGEIIGAQLYDGGDHYSWAVGVHNDVATTKSTDDEAKSVAARVSFAPIAEKGKVVHLGASQVYRVPDSVTDAVSFSATAENALQRLKSANTGTLTGVDSIYLTGLEAAGVYGPLSVQGEYFYTQVNRESLSDVNVGGWYSQVSYLVTGESRPYSASSGTFERIKPNRPFNLKDGGWGAFELTARYSVLDLNDGAVQGGEVRDTTLGANWYLNNNTRLMANYIMVNTDSVTPSGANVSANDDPNIILLRAAFDF